MPSATHRNTACGIAARTPCISQKDEPHLIGGRTVTRHAIRPASKTSAFDNIRAFSSRPARGLFPFRTSVSSCWRSSLLNLTTYVFTEISFAAILASIANPSDGSESPNPFKLVEAAD
jgi:hypothetical protein